MSETTREDLLEKARQFKAGWVELAEHLSKCASTKLYEQWGFRSIDDYCLKELHIKRATAMKLIGNYHFLARHEPEILERRQLDRLPDMDTMGVLAKARDNQNLSDEAWQELRAGAVDKGYAAATVHRKLKTMEPQTAGRDLEQVRKKVISLVNSIRYLFVEQGEVPAPVDAALKSILRFVEES